MSVAGVLAASLIVVPQPNIDHARRIQRRYPTDAVRDEKSAASLVRVRVDPTGKVYRCDTVAVVGDAELGEEACDTYLHANLEFSLPATGDGKPAYGLLTTVVKYFLPGTRQGGEIASIVQVPDLSFTVASLPDQFDAQLDFEIDVQVTAEGQVVVCEGVQDAPGAYVSVACNSLKNAGASILTDEADKPVTYVARMRVRFTSDADA